MKKIILAIGIVWCGVSMPLSIMLDPAGDARTPGRIIGESFERGITLQIATALKSVLEQMGPGIRVVQSRVPNETVSPLQNAHFANRLRVDLFVSIHCFQEPEPRTSACIYYLQYHPITDQWAKHEQLAFYPFDQAHLATLSRSMTYAEALKRTLQSSKGISCKGAFGIPFKPLVGITSPAVAIEVGLKNADDWQNIVHPLAQAIMGLFA